MLSVYTFLLLLVAITVAAYHGANFRPHGNARPRCIYQAGKLKCFGRHRVKLHLNRFGVTPAVGPGGIACAIKST